MCTLLPHLFQKMVTKVVKETDNKTGKHVTLFNMNIQSGDLTIIASLRWLACSIPVHGHQMCCIYG